jgi:HAD superfamily hydrolase (TIGR01509 family)
MIKAVLFDYGGVLNESGTTGSVQRVLAQVYKCDPDTIDIEQLHHDFLRGLITKQAYFKGIHERYGHSQPMIDETVYEGQNEAFFIRCQPVYDLAERLRANGIKTGILSNIYSITADTLRERGLYDGFDPVVLSYQEKVAKPDRAFFEAALGKLDLPGDQVIFVDDQERFREVAESLGMRFVTAVSPDQIVKDVEQLVEQENGVRLGAI